MRSMVFDELRPGDIQKLEDYFKKTLIASAMPGVYWLELAPDLLSGDQSEHCPNCGPYRLAVVLEEDQMRLELLVRASNVMRCSCIAYASKVQMEYVLGFLDRLIDELDIKT